MDDFVRNNHWDYARLDDDSTASNDPEAAMTNIVEQMADGNHFDYDVTTYTAEAPYAYNDGHAYVYPAVSYGCFYGSWDPWCDGYYPSPSYFGLDIGFGFGGFWGYRTAMDTRDTAMATVMDTDIRSTTVAATAAATARRAMATRSVTAGATIIARSSSARAAVMSAAPVGALARRSAIATGARS